MLVLVLVVIVALGFSGLGLRMIAGITVPILSGPCPVALLLFDVSDKQLWCLWVPVAIGYWCVLGTGAGLIGWTQFEYALKEKSTDPRRSGLRWARRSLLFAAFFGGCLGALVLLSNTGMVRSGPSIKGRIHNNLRQVDGAIQQFALEKKLPANAPVKEADLLPYLKQGIPRFGNERYVLKTVADTPYAVFESDWRIRRNGWRQGYTIPKGTEFRLP